MLFGNSDLSKKKSTTPPSKRRRGAAKLSKIKFNTVFRLCGVIYRDDLLLAESMA